MLDAFLQPFKEARRVDLLEDATSGRAVFMYSNEFLVSMNGRGEILYELSKLIIHDLWKNVISNIIGVSSC